MLKVVYSEIVSDRTSKSYGLLVEKTKRVGSLKEAVDFSRYIANTANVVGKPVVEEE